MKRYQDSPVDQAVMAHKRGSALPSPRLRNMEQRHSTRYIADLSRRLPGWEVELIAKATDLREQALEKARTGDIDAAQELLVYVGHFTDEQIPSLEGRLSARSFHAAAVAFLEHVTGNHDAAHDLLVEALTLCRRLCLDYAHSVEIRRVHLARNLVRVIWCLNRHRQAWEQCIGLINYVWSANPSWPLGEKTALELAQCEKLRKDERVFLTDQLLSEAISTAADARRHDLSFDAEACEKTALQRATVPDRIEVIEQLCRTIMTADLVSVVKSLTAFFEVGQGELPITWSRAERLFLEITKVPLS